MEKIILTKDNFKDVIKRTSQILKRGEVVVFPTDTLYALGVDASGTQAVDKFFALKKRPADKPVPIFVKDIEMARELAHVDEKQEDILKKFWPGPFTFVLRKKEGVSERLSANTEKIGLRIPDDEFCQALLKELDSPITGSSANISGMESGREADKIIEQFKEYSVLPELIIDAGDLPISEPSAVIDISGERPVILRESSRVKEFLDEF